MDPLSFQEHVRQFIGISLTSEQLNQFERYYQLLIEWNQKMNLTAITERNEVYEKHFFDSLTPIRFFSLHDVHSLIDVGSGAGFPGIPIKICFPHFHLTILDSLNKRITFLDQVVENLKLTDVSLIHGRAEEAARRTDLREQFDVATARAVAKLPTLAEYCMPFIKEGGTFFAMKGAQVEEEVKSSQKAVKSLGGKILEVQSLLLPFEKSERNIVFILKTKPTPAKYPRKTGLPAKKPII